MKAVAAAFAAAILPPSPIEPERSMMSRTSTGSRCPVGSPAPVTVRVTVAAPQLGFGDAFLATFRWGGLEGGG